MLEQTILRVEFITEAKGLTPVFGPLMNNSQRKHHAKEMREIADKTWNEILADNNPLKLSKEEVSEIVFNREYLTIKDMNLGGWKLESFALIWDDNDIKIQVAIFSRTVVDFID